MSTLKLGDVRLNYEVDDFTDPWRRSRTQAVVLHHGCGRNLNFFYRWVPIMARKYKVIRIDARGFGKSSDPGPDFKPSVRMFADDVLALMDHLGIRKAHWVGEHMGGFVGLELALQHPDRVGRLAISSAPYFSQPVKGMLDRIAAGGMTGYIKNEQQLRVGNNKALGDWFAEEFARSRPEVIKSVMQAASAVDYRPRLSELKSPTLVLMGEAFAMSRDPDGKVRASMQKSLPAASEVVTLKGKPWFVLYTDPELCARLCMRFFARKA